ncbi:hypothetical protein D3C87_664230 [compost metagenome]
MAKPKIKRWHYSTILKRGKMNIGDKFGGGVIFHVFEDGQTALVAALEDQVSLPGIDWGDFVITHGEEGDVTVGGYTIYTDAKETAIGKGRQNTDNIVEAIADVMDKASCARLCKELNLNGFNDWYLPSRDELVLMYDRRSFITGFSTSLSYYTSSNLVPNQNVPNYYEVYSVAFWNGSISHASSSNKRLVRAIRTAHIDDPVNPIKPAKPILTNSDNYDQFNSLPSGLTTDMEFKLNDGEWKMYSSTELNSSMLEGNHTVSFRYPADGINPPSDAVSYTYTPYVPPVNPEEPNVPGGDEPLISGSGFFGNIQEVKKHNSSISSSLELSNIQSFIDDAINFFLIPVIGYAQFQALVAAKPNLDANSKDYRLLQLLQKAAVGYLLSNYADNGAVQIGNTGISVAKTEKSAPASDKKLILLKRSNLKAAYAAREMAVSFLEENLTDFTAYAASNEHKQNRSLLINVTKEFETAGIYIKNDAQLFDSLKTYIGNATENAIVPLLGETLTEALQAAVLANNQSELQSKLLIRVRKPLAALAMAEAIPYRTVTIDANGVFELSEAVGGMAANVETRSSATDKRLSAIMTGLTMRADQELETLRKFINANAEALNITPEADVNINDGSADRVYFF